MSDHTDKPRWKERLYYPGLLLGGMALVASAALAIGDQQTRSAIAQRQAEDLQLSLAQVVPVNLYDNNPVADAVDVPDPTPRRVYRARKEGQVAAVAFQAVGQGFSGPIVMLMGVDRSGAVLGVRVLSHAETPGLGDKIEVQKGGWIRKFEGLFLGNPPPEKWGVKKDGGIFDQFSGATITPRAVVRGVKEGLEFFAEHRAELLDDAAAATTANTGSTDHGR